MVIFSAFALKNLDIIVRIFDQKSEVYVFFRLCMFGIILTIHRLVITNNTFKFTDYAAGIFYVIISFWTFFMVWHIFFIFLAVNLLLESSTTGFILDIFLGTFCHHESYTK